MHIVASEYLTPFYSIAPGALAAGGGYVWFSSRGWLRSRRKTLWQPQCGCDLARALTFHELR